MAGCQLLHVLTDLSHISLLIIIAFEARNPNFMLVALCLARRKILDLFGVQIAVWPDPIAFFRGLLPPETFERISVIFDYVIVIVMIVSLYITGM